MRARVALLGLFAFTSSASPIQPRQNALPAGFIAAPAYPAPHGGWTGDWTDSYAKAWDLVSRMTLAEKANITSGVGIFMGPCVGNTGSADRVGFRQLCLQDGPLGVRSTDNVTAFPAGITTGATWDKALMLARGEALGKEFRGKGANIHLGPSVGPLGRKPRGGRNWEGFGSDPVLQAIAATQTIKGVQSQGVIAVIKHIIANEQEIYRMYNPFQRAYSANVDDRAMHELYLWPFAEGIRAGVGSVMGAYNDVNGSQAGQNSYVLNHLLKEEMGFQGFVMSDWLAQQSGVAAALAGLDMAMPGDTIIPIIFGTSYWQYEMTRAVLNGSVPVDRLNDAATRIVAAWYQMGQDNAFPLPNFSANTADREGPCHPAAVISPTCVVNQYVNVQADHYKIARQVAQDAVTLLKNVDDVLPLSSGQRISVFGTSAATNPDGPNACTDKSCNKGVLGMGWGSGSANYPYMDAPIEAFRRVTSNVAYYNTDNFPGSVPQPVENEVAVVFITSDSGENSYTVEGNAGDRTKDGLSAWHGGDKLVQDVAAKYANVVVVVHTVGPIIVEPWIDLPSVKALVFAHLPGQEAGTSLTNVLFGDVSPSGHLPYSIPRREDDYPASVSLVGGAIELGQVQDTYSEGLYIDYRALNKAGVSPRYAFGHGLSYASFSFGNASITALTPLSEFPPAPPPRGAAQPYSTNIPPASEAVGPPPGFKPVWRYLYSWLSEKDAKAAATAANTSTYPYPEGYSNVQPTTSHPAGGGQGGNPALWDVAFEISLTVTNISPRNVSGRAVAQAYVQFPSDNGGFDTPVIQLRDFAKTRTLTAGESEGVVLRLTRKDVSVWDVVSQNWKVPNPRGRYRVWIGEVSDKFGVVCRSDELLCEEREPDPVIED